MTESQKLEKHNTTKIVQRQNSKLQIFLEIILLTL